MSSTTGCGCESFWPDPEDQTGDDFVEKINEKEKKMFINSFNHKRISLMNRIRKTEKKINSVENEPLVLTEEHADCIDKERECIKEDCPLDKSYDLMQKDYQYCEKEEKMRELKIKDIMQKLEKLI